MTGDANPDPVLEAQRQQEKQAVFGRLPAIAAGIKANMPGNMTSDHSCLYDENGFPR